MSGRGTDMGKDHTFLRLRSELLLTQQATLDSTAGGTKENGHVVAIA